MHPQSWDESHISTLLNTKEFIDFYPYCVAFENEKFDFISFSIHSRCRPSMRQGEVELPEGGRHAEGEGREDEGWRKRGNRNQENERSMLLSCLVNL